MDGKWHKRVTGEGRTETIWVEIHLSPERLYSINHNPRRIFSLHMDKNSYPWIPGGRISTRVEARKSCRNSPNLIIGVLCPSIIGLVNVHPPHTQPPTHMAHLIANYCILLSFQLTRLGLLKKKLPRCENFANLLPSTSCGGLIYCPSFSIINN